MRATPYVSKPSPEWNATANLLTDTTLFLVAKTGPTVFAIRDDTDSTFRVTIGNPHACTCSISKNVGKPCIHIIFSLLKVLKVPRSHPLCFQSSLTDTELNQVLDGLAEKDKKVIKRQFLKRADKVDNNDEVVETGKVARQVLCEDEEETCPICQDEMNKDQALTWCRSGCGNNIHAKCMLKFCQYKISNKQSASCPLCREDWDMNLLKQDCKGKSSSKNSCAPVRCSVCRSVVRGIFTRCIECSNKSLKANGLVVDFCEDCVRRPSAIHTNHHFVCSDGCVDASDVTWTAKKNPLTTNTSREAALARELQFRELNVNDYDMLLDLDRDHVPDISHHLVDSLPKTQTNPQNAVCWCGVAQVDMKGLCRLPCGHSAHPKCVLSDLEALSAEENSSGDLGNYRCSHVDCGKLVFIGLNRRKAKRKVEIDKLKVDEKDTRMLAQNSLIIGLTGNGFRTNKDRKENNFQVNQVRVKNDPRSDNLQVSGLSQMESLSNQPIRIGSSDKAYPPVASTNKLSRKSSRGILRAMNSQNNNNSEVLNSSELTLPSLVSSAVNSVNQSKSDRRQRLLGRRLSSCSEGDRDYLENSDDDSFNSRSSPIKSRVTHLLSSRINYHSSSNLLEGSTDPANRGLEGRSHSQRNSLIGNAGMIDAIVGIGLSEDTIQHSQFMFEERDDGKSRKTNKGKIQKGLPPRRPEVKKPTFNAEVFLQVSANPVPLTNSSCKKQTALPTQERITLTRKPSGQLPPLDSLLQVQSY